MQKPIFTQQQYSPDQYLNPSSAKIRPNLLKKSKIYASTHCRSFSLEISKTQRVSEMFVNQSKIPNNNPQLRERFRQAVYGPLTPIKQQKESNDRQQLIARNKSLEQALRSKDSELIQLREKYEDLRVRLQLFSSRSAHSQNCSFSFDSSLRTGALSRRSDNLSELRRLRERLREIGFSRLFKLVGKGRRTQ